MFFNLCCKLISSPRCLPNRGLLPRAPRHARLGFRRLRRLWRRARRGGATPGAAESAERRGWKLFEEMIILFFYLIKATYEIPSKSATTTLVRRGRNALARLTKPRKTIGPPPKNDNLRTICDDCHWRKTKVVYP